MKFTHLPKKTGLYDPRYEHENCGVGFVCNINGNKSNKIVQDGLKVLENMTHRGAVGADPLTGDGAGILIQMPHEYFSKVCSSSDINLPEFGQYGSGIIFFPTDLPDQKYCLDNLDKIVKEEKQELLGYRDVPVDNSIIGETAKASEPIIKQIFIKNNEKDIDAFERKLYVIRKRIENLIKSSKIEQKTYFYITNLSAKTFSYKGLLTPVQVAHFFVDLKSPDIKSSVALVHSRYSTNTFPTWDLAQPFRYLAHNGEINTLRGNINWMEARHELLESPLFKEDIKKIFPVVVPNGSDSASIDNAFELLVLSGRSLAHAMLMLIPCAWEKNEELNKDLKAFYEYHACLMEPWDGPAAVAFTDGKQIGALLDRNGLRPARYIITKDGFVVMASEMGVLDIDPKNIKTSGRLEPGKMFLIDTEKKEIIDDKEIKKEISNCNPYKKWIDKNLINFDDISCHCEEHSDAAIASSCNLNLFKSFGYTREDFKTIFMPLIKDAKEAIGSMGDDTPHAVLSKRSMLIYRYFKQLFAQVTNPAIDPIREKIVMSLDTFLGPESNILDETENHAKRIKVCEPILTNEEISKFNNTEKHGFKTTKISVAFNDLTLDGFNNTLKRIESEALDAVLKGSTFLIISDDGVDSNKMAVPMLLATGLVHHALIKKHLRKEASIIVQSFEPRETHHFATLFGYGADCINPYGAFAAIENILSEDKSINLDLKTAIKNYRTGINNGILKILSKMGISTIQSYRGAQIFEAIGVHEEVINKCFVGTTSRIGGVKFKEIFEETRKRHKQAFALNDSLLDVGGTYQWNKDGEFHLWNPESIACLQHSVKTEDYLKYKEFCALINDQSMVPTTLRSLLKFKKTQSIPLEAVEPIESIVKRFATGAMSFGSISRGAHESLAIAMNRIGGASNTGEGGEDPLRFVPMPNGDSKRSKIKQVASGRFGVTANYLTNADEIQIKIAQGAKPGEGGQLPGHKVSVEIARTRYTTAGVTLISPPPHHDIYSIEDLAQLIYDLKNASPDARITVKLVSVVGVGTVAAGVAKAHADMILISGADGGTGASPLSSIKYTGLPWELGLSETHQTLVLNDLRDRVRLQADGQMRTGRDVIIASLLGAEEYGFCSSALIVMGCVMLRHCHLNVCSLGVATQNEILKEKFRGNVDHVVTYMKFIAREVRELMASLGISKMDDLIGRTDLLEVNKDIVPEKAINIDFSKILYRPEVKGNKKVYKVREQDHNIDKVLDRTLIEKSRDALVSGKSVDITETIRNVNRTTGAMLSNAICKNYGDDGLPDDTINIKFNGVAGQSFGAFLAHGITFELEGLANDYVGKGISGGKIIIYPYKDSDYIPEENILIGNTTFYGAIRGEAYIRGIAGERFCIRNSGLNAVVEGTGDHACEYMTGGLVLVLGPVGRNFAAGMSGGIAYIYDKNNDFENKCNKELVLLEKLEKDDITNIEILLHNHLEHTDSAVARYILDNFHESMEKIVKVIPIEYKRILETRKLEEKLGTDESL